MKRILITGGAGFIGGSLAERLVENPNNHVVIVDNLLTGSMENVPNCSNCMFIKCNVNDYHEISSIMTSSRFDYVFHYAAVVGVQRTLENPVMVLNDIQGIKNVLDLCKNTGVKRVFYSSSSEVYGEPVNLPQYEDITPLNSRLPYAVVKNIGEAFCRSYCQEFDLKFTILRFFNTYGPKQSNDFVITKFIDAALSGIDLTIYGDGTQSRTFCYIEDNVEFTIKILEESHFINDVVNVGNDELTPIKKLAEEIIRITGSISGIEFLPPLKEGDMKRRQPDITKMKKVIRRELTTLEQGIGFILLKLRFNAQNVTKNIPTGVNKN